MGTIGNQPERTDYVFEDSKRSNLEIEIKDMLSTAKRHGVTLQDVIALRAAISRESLVRTMREDGDFRDEHAAGIESALRSIGEDIGGAVASIAEVLENKL